MGYATSSDTDQGGLYRHSFKAMGCPCQICFYPGDNSAASLGARLEAEIRRLEQRYSRYRSDSITSRINNSAGSGSGLELDAESSGLINYALTCYQESDGLFDITSGVLRKIWDFSATTTTINIPDKDQLEQVMSRVGWDKIVWEHPYLELPVSGMEIDFGGLVKEYAADVCANLARSLGIHHGLVDMGGDISIIGPQPDNSPWTLGIRHPENKSSAVAEISLAQGSLATSGDYERYLEIEGQRYSHILNPFTGWPVRGLMSVSVVAEQCLVAGTSATIALLKGNEGINWLDTLGLPNLRIDHQNRVSGSLQ